MKKTSSTEAKSGVNGELVMWDLSKTRFSMKMWVRVLHYLFAEAKESGVRLDCLIFEDENWGRFIKLFWGDKEGCIAWILLFCVLGLCYTSRCLFSCIDAKPPGWGRIYKNNYGGDACGWLPMLVRKDLRRLVMPLRRRENTQSSREN